MSSEPSNAVMTNDGADTLRTSWLLAGVAAVALIGNGLLTSPSGFSQEHKDDSSLLKVVISALALTAPSGELGGFPTARGVEIRNLCFYLGAALLAFLAGFRLAVSGAQPRLSMDDLFDLRQRASGPYFWWALLLVLSVITSVFSHAPDVCQGQVVIRFMHFAWWCALGALLSPRHVRGLITVLLGVITAVAVVGIWHYSQRVEPGWFTGLFGSEWPKRRLQYPIGNELWFGACLVPAVFIGMGFMIDRARRRSSTVRGSSQPSGGALRVTGLLALAVGLAAVLCALFLTRSRSAIVGIGAGIIGFLVLAVPKKMRLFIVLVGLILAIVGAWYVQSLRTTGVMGQRAHSIRSRLDYEWPYAFQLFFSKPVGGHGEGCYTMLAGQMARVDQIEDPSVMAVEDDWTAHAHNEWLELLADVGIAGVLAFFLTIATTLYWAARYCDRHRENHLGSDHRWLAIGMAAALIAMVFEESSNVAIRHPGFPPIFLTVWAGLWALVRDERSIPTSDESTRMSSASLRLAGVAAMLTGLLLGYFGVQDWRAARARFEAGTRLIESRKYAEAARLLDFSGANTLDPLSRLITRREAIQARMFDFDQWRQTEARVTDEKLAAAWETLGRLDKLNRDAPRFAKVSRLSWKLSRSMADAYLQREEVQYASGVDELSLDKLTQYRADEPFNIGLVEALWWDPRIAVARERSWQRKQDLAARRRHLRERLEWLQCLLRRRSIDNQFRVLVEDFYRYSGADQVMKGVQSIALQDFDRSASNWQDRLSPETLRIAALVENVNGQPAKAVELVRQAEEMYQKAGPRLFLAHGGAIREAVQYQFEADPTGDSDALLRELARAHKIMTGVDDEKGALPLPAPLGKTRLKILIAAERTDAAKAQLTLLNSEDGVSMPRLMARAYANLAGQFTFSRPHAELVTKWAARAVELGPDLVESHFARLGLFLEQGEDASALAAAKRVIEIALEKETAYAMLQRVEMRWPHSGIWAELRRAYSDFPKRAKTSASSTSPTTSQPGEKTDQNEADNDRPIGHDVDVPEVEQDG